MFVGHYGVSFAAKRSEPQLSLWVLFVAVQLLDVAWSPLVLLGVEKVRIVPGITASNPLDLYYMPYTHSLVAACVWSLAALVTYRAATRSRQWTPSIVLAGAVLSHWILDFIVHRPDLPLYDNSAKVGLGLWNVAPLAFGLETAILFGGMYLYLRRGTTRRVPMVLFGFIMLAIQAFVFFGPPPASPAAAAAIALASYVVFAFIVARLERRRVDLGSGPARAVPVR